MNIYGYYPENEIWIPDPYLQQEENSKMKSALRMIEEKKKQKEVGDVSVNIEVDTNLSAYQGYAVNITEGMNSSV
jgi:hypothetical protein